MKLINVCKYIVDIGTFIQGWLEYSKEEENKNNFTYQMYIYITALFENSSVIFQTTCIQ